MNVLRCRKAVLLPNSIGFHPFGRKIMEKFKLDILNIRALIIRR